MQVAGNHYSGDKVKMDVFDFCAQFDLTPREFSVVKYIARNKKKNGAIDVCKAINCATRVLKDEYNLKGTEVLDKALKEFMEKNMGGYKYEGKREG